MVDCIGFWNMKNLVFGEWHELAASSTISF